MYDLYQCLCISLCSCKCESRTDDTDDTLTHVHTHTHTHTTCSTDPEIRSCWHASPPSTLRGFFSLTKEKEKKVVAGGASHDSTRRRNCEKVLNKNKRGWAWRVMKALFSSFFFLLYCKFCENTCMSGLGGWDMNGWIFKQAFLWACVHALVKAWPRTTTTAALALDGRTASGGALAPEPPRASSFQPHSMQILFSHSFFFLFSSVQPALSRKKVRSDSTYAPSLRSLVSAQHSHLHT